MSLAPAPYDVMSADRIKSTLTVLKSNLLMTLIMCIKNEGWSQSEAARKLDVSPPRMCNLFKGHLDHFTVDALAELLVRVGYDFHASSKPERPGQPLILTVCKTEPALLNF